MPQWSAGLLPDPLNGYPGFKQLEQIVNAQQVAILEAGSGGRDDAPMFRAAIQDAVAARRRYLRVRDGTYTIASEVALPTGFRLVGDSMAGTIILHLPTADGNCFRVTAGAAQASYTAIEHLTIYSPDLIYTKCAIELDDVSSARVENVLVYGAGTGIASFYSGGTGSIGLRTKGREVTGLRGLKLVADKPIVISANPNTLPTDGEDIDHWHGSDFYLVAKGNYNIAVDDGLGIISLTLDGYQAWVGGVGGIKINDTRVAPVVPSRHIRIANVRGEQCTDPTGYWFNLSFAQPAQTIMLENCLGAATAQGIKVVGCLQLLLDNVTMTRGSGDGLNVSGGFGSSSVFMRGCYWQPGSAVTLTGYTAAWIGASDPTVKAGPTTALYVDTSRLHNGDTKTGTLASYVTATTTSYGATVGVQRRAMQTNEFGTYLGDGDCSGADDFVHIERNFNGSTGILVFNRTDGVLTDAFLHMWGGVQDVSGSDLRIAAQSSALGGEVNLVSRCNSLGTNPNAALNLINASAGAVAFYANNAKQVMVLPTASTNRYMTLTGSNGANPTIDVTAGNLRITAGTSDIQWGKALVALGGGAAPTLGTIGGSGPASAAQNSWLRLLDSTGAACWVPVWK